MWYCISCLEGMVRVQLADTGFRLPQCCRTVFEWEQLQAAINPELAAAFDKKRREFESVRPTYCSDSACAGSSALIAPEHHSVGDETATCPVCSNAVCTKCKQGSHPGRECVADAAKEQTPGVVQEKGWQRCSWCGDGFERVDGCSHMK
jgi:hypothetical protein